MKKNKQTFLKIRNEVIISSIVSTSIFCLVVMFTYPHLVASSPNSFLYTFLIIVWDLLLVITVALITISWICHKMLSSAEEEISFSDN